MEIIVSVEQIKELLKYGEKINLECKKAEANLPKSVWETYSSFANTTGGIILFGVEEKKAEIDPSKRFLINDINNADKVISDFWNTINSEKVNVNILIDSNVGKCEIEGRTVVWIEVPQASYKQKPVFLNGNPLKGSYKRNHEGDYHCTEEEVKAMLRDASDSGNDGGILDGYTLEDIDYDTLKSYRIEYELRNPEHVWNGLDNTEFLRNLGAYARERNTGREGLTTAGLLMFGKGLSIRERFDNIRMDYIDESNLLPESRWSDRLTYDGMWENNLYNFMKRIVPKLVSDLKRPFKLDGMTRVDDTPVHKAIRESVVNMMIHSDYMITGVLKVIKRNDGFYFSNPGNLKLPINTIYEGGHSVARNPRIQTMFRMIGLGDNIGSGFPTILNAWGEENWRKPDLSENPELHQVDLKLWMISLMPIECTEYLQRLFGMAYQHLSSNEQIVLATAQLENEVTNTRLQAMLDLHSTEVGKLLAELVEKRMLIVKWKGRWTTYSVNTDYVIQGEQVSITDLEVPDVSLNKTDRQIYEYVKTNEFITLEQIMAITRITTKQGALKAVNRLETKKLIFRDKKGKETFYRINK